MAATERRPDAPAFGPKLREVRTAAGLTQEELAERTGLSVRGISDLERGARSHPHFETVRLLADALELTPESRAALMAAARPPAEAPRADSGPAIEVVSSLPVPATRLIGREREIEEAVDLLDHGELRLLTLTGPGGVGKTRLALEVASRSADADGAVFVDLAPIRGAELVATTIVRALGLRDAGDRSPEALLKEALKDRQMLLLLDNFEQVVAAAPFVGELLTACPNLKILVTSRTPLRVRGEQEYPVPSLATPDPKDPRSLAEIEESPAIALFVQRARTADPHFSLDTASAPSVIEVCYRLDGLPLAIELAAARIKLLSPEMLVGRAGRQLPLLSAGPHDAPARHRTMTATLVWSYDLLSVEAKTLFRRFAVFAGGGTLEAVEAVCAGGLSAVFDLLSELADQGLIQRAAHQNVSPRFRMQEVVREYAGERLEESGELVDVQGAHTAYYLEFSELAKAELTGPHQGAWMTRLTIDESNLDAALEFAIDQKHADTALQLGGNLWAYWDRRGHLWEGRMWLERALTIAGDPSSRSRLRVLNMLANLALEMADFARAQSLFTAVRDLSQELKDEAWTTVSRQGLGLVALNQGDYDGARTLYMENLEAWRALGNRQRESVTLGSLGDVENAVGHTEEARALHQEALSIQQEIGDVGGIAYSTLSLAETTYTAGEPATAQPMFERSLGLFENVGDQIGVAHARYGLGRVASLLHENLRAGEQFAEALALRREFGDRRGIVECVEGLAGVALEFGETERATRLFGAAATARAALRVPVPPVARPLIDAHLEALRGDLGVAAFERAWSVGQVMTIEQAATEAASMSTAWRDRDT